MMEVAQVRLPKKLIETIDSFVDDGFYSNRSEVIREAVRDLAIKKVIGIIPDTGDSVKEVKEIRSKLSKEKVDLGEINRFGKEFFR